MEYFFAYLLILFGFIFIVSQLYPDSLLSKSYDGVICEIDEDSKTIVVQYEKKGEKCKATFSVGNIFPDSIVTFEFHYYIGMEVNIVLDKNDKIQILSHPKSINKKRKISWKIVWIGLFMLGFGLLEFILLVFNV